MLKGKDIEVAPSKPVDLITSADFEDQKGNTYKYDPMHCMGVDFIPLSKSDLVVIVYSLSNHHFFLKLECSNNYEIYMFDDAEEAKRWAIKHLSDIQDHLDYVIDSINYYVNRPAKFKD